MEIEAKFEIPDEAVLQELRSVSSIGDFTATWGKEVSVRDEYIDTEDWSILRAGYACRRRKTGGSLLITLKSIQRTVGPVHRREELEVELPTDVQPTAWPESPARDLTLQLIGDSLLGTILDLTQHRSVLTLTKNNRTVAELSLDAVRSGKETGNQVYHELEVELLKDGTEEDLSAIVSHLESEYNLSPQPLSKFERALSFLRYKKPTNSFMSSEEREICSRIAPSKDMYGRRAAVLLALDDGKTQRDAGRQAGMSARRARHWRSEFRRRRMGVFPSRMREVTESEVQPQGDAAPWRPQRETDQEKSWTVERLLDRYDLDQAHARAVSEHALALFDHLRDVHGLKSRHRQLLTDASLLHNIGLQQDPDRHHAAGHDIVLAQPVGDLNEIEQNMVATMVFLHRKRVTTKRLTKLAVKLHPELSEQDRRIAFVLGSLLRMGDGLDYSQTNTSKIHSVEDKHSQITFHIVGPHSSTDAVRAQKKSDLWHLLFDTRLDFSPSSRVTSSAREQLQAHAADHSPATTPGLALADSMAEAARKTLLFHYHRMVRHEPGTRLGEDIEELHDMRVATRRMRAALQVFGPHLDMNGLAPFLKGLKRTGRALGAVRDLDVFWETVEEYLLSVPELQRPDLSPLHRVWGDERESARQRMLTYLDGASYMRFKEEFGTYLQYRDGCQPPVSMTDGRSLPQAVSDAVPVAVYERLALVRSYDRWITAPGVPLELFHQLRIACKGLRYTFEFFREILGDPVKHLIKEMKAQQDHLGALQDAVVASSVLQNFLTRGSWNPPKKGRDAKGLPSSPIIAPGVATYMASRQQEVEDLLKTYPDVWDRLRRAEFTRQVMRALEPTHFFTRPPETIRHA